MSKRNIDKIKRGDNVSSTELSSAASTAGVKTTDQGRPRDLHSVAAELAKTLGVTVKIHQ